MIRSEIHALITHNADNIECNLEKFMWDNSIMVGGGVSSLDALLQNGLRRKKLENLQIL